MAVGKKKRFDVFKRDGFTCQYCGGKPPGVVLECDHIDPSSKGGSDDIDNLITACFDCNRGKSNGTLDVAPPSVTAKAQVLAEQREQLKAYRLLKRAIEAENKRVLDDISFWIDVHLHDFFKCKMSDDFKKNSLMMFIKKGLGSEELYEAWDITMEKFSLGGNPMNNLPTKGHGAEHSLKYFCGVCWRMVKEDHQGISQK